MGESDPGAASRARARRLLARLVAPHRRAIGALLVLACVQTALTTAVPWLVGVAIDTGIPHARESDHRALTWVGIAMAGCAVASGLLSLVWTGMAGRMGQSVVRALRTELFDKVQSLSVPFHDRMRAGQVISWHTSDIDDVAVLFGVTLTRLLQAVFMITAMTCAMLLLDTGLALLTLASLVPLALLTVWQVRRLGPAFRQQRAATADATAHVVESLNAIRAVQAFRRQRRNDDVFAVHTGRIRTATTRILRLHGVFWPALELIFSLTALLVVVVGGLQVSWHELQVGVLAAFVLYVAQFFGPVISLPSAFDALQSALAGLENIAAVLAREPEVAEPAHPVALERPVRGEVVLTDVRFSYRPCPSGQDGEDGEDEPGAAPGDRPVPVPRAPEIPGLSLRLEPGQVVILLGATGTGKSTLAKLIARFYDPAEGRITLDGVDLRDLADRDMRASVTLLTQEGFLFAGSVADNIAVGRPSATRSEIEAAARAVGADDFIRSLPQGYDTDVRKRGTRLSAGQRQLVAFARALLIDPAVVILDEATSALDIPTERALQQALRSLLADRTALVIAHRLSTVEMADRVLVLADGQVVEDGKPGDLLAQNTGEFAALYRDSRGQAIGVPD